MIIAVLNKRQSDDLETKKVRADLYIFTNKGQKLFYEMKSPKPNKRPFINKKLSPCRVG